MYKKLLSVVFVCMSLYSAELFEENFYDTTPLKKKEILVTCGDQKSFIIPGEFSSCFKTLNQMQEGPGAQTGESKVIKLRDTFIVTPQSLSTLLKLLHYVNDALQERTSENNDSNYEIPAVYALEKSEHFFDLFFLNDFQTICLPKRKIRDVINLARALNFLGFDLIEKHTENCLLNRVCSVATNLLLRHKKEVDFIEQLEEVDHYENPIIKDRLKSSLLRGYQIRSFFVSDSKQAIGFLDRDKWEPLLNKIELASYREYLLYEDRNFAVKSFCGNCIWNKDSNGQDLQRVSLKNLLLKDLYLLVKAQKEDQTFPDVEFVKNKQGQIEAHFKVSE